MTEPLAEMEDLQGKPFHSTWERNGTKLKLLIRPGIVTTDFLDNLAGMYRAEKTRAAEAAITQAATAGNRSTRRKLASAKGRQAVKREAKAEGVEVNVEKAATAPAGDGATALDARLGHMRFMAETCYRVVADWNLGRRGVAVPLSVEEFRLNWDYDTLETFFEFVCFEAAAPKK